MKMTMMITHDEDDDDLLPLVAVGCCWLLLVADWVAVDCWLVAVGC